MCGSSSLRGSEGDRMKRKRAVAVKPVRGEPARAEVQVPASTPPGRPPLNRFVRWAINLWVLFHFAAVLAAANSVGPTSELIVAAWKPFRPYLQVLYLNQGYNFYAPQPAPSTLLSYKIEGPDGTIIQSGRILDRTIAPRLLYHRYLLLTEHLVFVSEEAQTYWYKSYARHLCHKYGGTRVGLTRIIHYPATMEMIRNGSTLNEPFSYEQRFVGDFACSEF
jgi:hypothetical protein